MTEFSNALGRVADKVAEVIGLRPDSVQAIIDDETRILGEAVGVTRRNSIPPTNDIPLQNPSNWFEVPDVIACFVDMEGSTNLSATTHPKTTAKAYRYFTNTAVRIFDDFDADYIDVRGDGVFALFNGDRPHTALAATVSFKDFVKKEFTPRIKKLTDLNIGGHYGIDRKTVLVRRMGLKFYNGDIHRQNEVWAGRPINMAAKLASRSSNDAIWVSKRFHECLWGENALKTCGCVGGKYTAERTELWGEESVEDDQRFDFDTAYVLKSDWCERHGKAFCKSIVKYDKEKETRRSS
jgi:class 3 adenylate cyclase